MGLADTAELLVKLKMQDDTSATAGKVKTSLGGLTTAAAAVATVGFGALTKGALDAEAAQGKFMAATGASREEAKQFVSSMDGLAGSAGAVGMSFEDIAAAGTAVAQQFGVTGEEAQALTGDILEFSKVTGQDAEQAAFQLEDTLSAFGLTATDAAGFMDELVLSNQKFGTDAGPATLSVLQNMAPALATMGGDLEDGVGFLNLFESAGLDAGKASVALTKAVKELKPGQTLDDLIAQIGAIEDPTLRAQKAMEIFGTKSGVGLANAIKPGMTSLDEYSVSAEEAAGAVETAADSMLTTSDRIRGMFDKLGAGAREVGQQFGPLVTGLASVGSLTAPLAGKFVTLLKDLGAKILPAAAATGTATGLAEGEAQVAGATGPSALRAFLTKFGLMTPAKVAAATTAGEAAGAAEAAASAAAAGGSAATSAASAAGLGLGSTFGLAAVAGAAMMTPQIIEKLTGTDPSSKLYAAGGAAADHYISGSSDEIKAAYQQRFFAAVNETLENRSLWDKLWNNGVQSAYESGAATANAWAESAGQGIVGSADPLADDVRESITQAGLAAQATARTVGEGVATDMSGGWERTLEEKTAIGLHSWAVQMQTGVGETVHGFTRTLEERTALGLGIWAEQVREHGKQAGHELSMGLNQSLPDVHSAWEQFKTDMKNTLDPMKELTWLQGKLSGDQLARGLESTNPLQRAKAETMRDTIVGQISQLQTLLGIEGQQGGDAVGDGIGSPQNQSNATTNANKLASAAKNALNNNPWSAWGSGVGSEWVSGIASGIDHKTWFLQNKIDKLFEPHSPPKVAPHIDDHGRKTGELWAESMMEGAGSAFREMPSLFDGRKVDLPVASGGIQRPIPRTSEVYPGRMPAIDFRPRLTIELNTRQVDDEMGHYRFIQGRTG